MCSSSPHAVPCEAQCRCRQGRWGVHCTVCTVCVCVYTYSVQAERGHILGAQRARAAVCTLRLPHRLQHLRVRRLRRLWNLFCIHSNPHTCPILVHSVHCINPALPSQLQVNPTHPLSTRSKHTIHAHVRPPTPWRESRMRKPGRGRDVDLESDRRNRNRNSAEQNRTESVDVTVSSDSRTTDSNASTASQAAATTVYTTVSTKQATMHLLHPTWEEDGGRFGA